MTARPNAFVIMPFDIEFTSIYEKLIKQSLEEIGYNVSKADSLTDQKNILSSIIQGISKANLIVADLTTTNPNVFYELGLCHGLGLPVILIAQSMSDVPFDLRSYRVHVYETHFDRIGKLKDYLREIGRRHLTGDILFSNPINDFSMGSVTAADREALAAPQPAMPVAQPVDDTPPGFWEFFNDANKAMNELTGILNRLLKANGVVTTKIAKHTASMQMLSNNPAAGSARRFQKISLLASNDINAFSAKVEEMLPEFENVVDRLSENYSGFLDLIDPHTEKDHQSILDLKGKIGDLLNGTRDARKGLLIYQGAAVELEKKRISRDLIRAARRQAEALGGIISNVERVETFCSNVLALINGKFKTEQNVTDRSS
jgi:hypothetical protein